MMRRRVQARGRNAEAAPSFVVVTGLSGAGKSQTIRALEDLGYFCVDNLPVALIPTFADLVLQGRGETRRAAVVVDIREGAGLRQFPQVYRALKRRYGRTVRLVFLEANDESLIRRFSETRRPHPLGTDRSVAEGVREERQRLLAMRRLADRVLDTSALTVHELRRSILETMGGQTVTAPLAVSILSFGFRRGVPADADLVFDVRFLPNPHFIPSLRKWSGRHARVSRYVLRSPAAKKFLSLTETLLRFLLPQYIAEGKSYLTVAIGCTGGRHRSVALAEALGRRLRRTKGIELRVRHRDVSES
jgi:RNase adapter protein RapZ